MFQSLIFDQLIVMLIFVALFSLIYYYRGYIFSYLQIRQYQKKEIEIKPIIAVRECPNCGQTMEEGYLIGPRGIYWVKNAPTYSFLNRDFFVGAEQLGFPYQLSHALRTQHFKSYRCKRCNMVLIKLTEQSLGP